MYRYNLQFKYLEDEAEADEGAPAVTVVSRGGKICLDAPELLAASTTGGDGRLSLFFFCVWANGWRFEGSRTGSERTQLV